MTRNLLRSLFALIVLVAGVLAGPSASAQTTACSGAGCVGAGPRLASISSSQGVLLNGLLNSLAGTGSSINVSAADWQSIASGSISLPKLLGSIQSSQSLGTPTQALNSQLNVGTLVQAMAATASSQGNTQLAAALNNVGTPLNVSSGTIAVGDLVKTDSGLGNTSLNALELVTGSVQTLNAKNAVATPQAVTLSGSALGLSGVGNVSLQAQVVEPPVYVCGTVGSTFHTASIRLKLNLALLNQSVNTGALTALLGIASAQMTLVNLDLYVELAKGNGIITQLNALANSMTVQATPGVADLYLGVIADSVFFDRTRGVASTIATSNIGYSTLGSVVLNGLATMNIGIRSSAIGSAGTATNLTFTGTTETTQTAMTGVAFASNLVGTLVANMQIQLTPTLPLVTGLVATTLQSVIQSAVSGVLSPVLTSVIQPLLSDLGVGLGEMDVNGAGAYYLCTVSGTVYNDLNHNARIDVGEGGLATPMYAKLVATNATTGPATVAATVDPTSGIYSFTNIPASAYSLVINPTSGNVVVTAAAPTGWLPIEQPTMTRSVTVAATNLTGLNYGFWNGSRLSGTVFKDTGIGTGGIANNVIRDGTEAAVAALTVKITDTTGGTAYDSTTTDATGAYSLWIPAAAGATSLKVTQVVAASWIAVGANVGTTSGTFTQATNTVAFTNALAATYTGVNFAVVPANLFITDGQQSAMPGTDVFYTHVFTAGTAGQLTLTPSAVPGTGWSVVPYADANCDGKLQITETAVTSALTVVADQKVCLVVKVFVPENAPISSRYAMTLTAHFVYANNTLLGDAVRNDLTLVGNAAAGLLLTKTVDKATAAVGDTLTYTITYLNQSSSALQTLKVYDATPAYTTFVSATCGTVVSGMVCTVPTKPAAGAVGAIQWGFTGNLPAGATGTVVLSVQVQ